MARRRRDLMVGAKYHVTARANRQEKIFVDDQFKSMFLGVIKRAKKRYNFNVSNFCIMGNHIHLMIEPGKDENLSKIMQWILSVFAQQYNFQHDYKGHVWYDRFKSKIISTFLQFLRTFKYIANNPVRANLAQNPLQYAFNGITYYQKGDYAGILDPPTEEIRKTIAELLSSYDPEKAQKKSEELSFGPKKPGRKKKQG